MQQHVDVLGSLDAICEVAGHVGTEVVFTDDHDHSRGVPGHEQRGLTGRVPTAHDRHRVARADLRLHRCGCVEHTRALELVESLDRQSPIVSASRNEHRLGHHLLAASELEQVVAVGPVESYCLGGHGDPRAELLCLEGGALGELGAGDPRGEAEGVLDERRGAGLSTGGDGVESHRVEPLRGAVYGGREAGRAGADHDEVAGRLPRSRRAHADRPCELRVARVAQHLAPAHDHDRRLRGTHPELAQQRLGRLVALEVDPAVRQAVARGELAEPARLRRVPRPDQPQAGTQPDQELAPDQEGANDQVAELSVLLHGGLQALDRNPEYLAGLANDGRVEGRLPGEQAQLAQESAGPVDGYEPLRRRAVAVDGRHQPGEHYEEVVARITFAEEDFAVLGAPSLTLAAEGGDLLLAQPRIGAVEVWGLTIRLWRIHHLRVLRRALSGRVWTHNSRQP